MHKISSVSEILSLIANVLDDSFRSVCLEGEIKGLTQSASKHWYFSITDSQSSLPCVLFQMSALKNPLIKILKDGDKVILSGSLGLYKIRGNLQLIVSSIQKIGRGDFFQEFEKLKERLRGEGLFDEAHKKEIPPFCQNVVLVTSEHGAALTDFINIFKRRSLFMNLVLVPALVQGEEAPSSLIRALKNIKRMIQEKNISFDVVILMRGGGSIEDLWAFNNEELAREIYSFPIPTLSAVGHQSDFTICDFVADKRAETPSAAAEMLTQNQMDLVTRLKNLKMRIVRNLDNFELYYKNKIEQKNPVKILGLLWDLLEGNKQRLQRTKKIERFTEIYGINEKVLRLDEMLSRLTERTQLWASEKTFKLENLGTSLQTLNPQNVLKRGYLIMKSADGKVVPRFKNFEEFKFDEPMTLTFFDGEAQVYRKN